MSSTVDTSANRIRPTRSAARRAPAPGSQAAFALAGLALLALYGPTVWSLSHSLWQDDTHSHGPIVLVVAMWLFARGIRFHLDQTPPDRRLEPRPLAGGLWLAIGLVAYVAGRSQSLYVLEVGSAIPVTLGLVLLLFGGAMARRLWFCFAFLIFLVPLPGSLIDTITHPMKLGVSWTSEHLLAWLDYPVARSGVILQVGQYQLFVADACAGLNSLFMLEAFGLLYLNVVRHESPLRNVILAILIVPISFASNVVRVVILALVTYHWGDAAGQGFVHSFSGMVLFGVALLLTVSADTMVRAVARRFSRPTAEDLERERAPTPGLWPTVRTWAGVTLPVRQGAVVAGLALACAGAAVALTPHPVPGAKAGDLEALIPKQFGEWTMLDRPRASVGVVAAEPGETNLNNPYDQVVMRTYRNAAGDVIDLAVAYGAHQRQEVKIHQPELCFNSQGFRVKTRTDTAFPRPPGDAGPTITGKHLYTAGERGSVAVSYWIRIGSVYADSAWETRWHIFSQGLKGRATDGILVRATTRVVDVEEARTSHAQMDRFLADLLVHASPELRRVLAP